MVGRGGGEALPKQCMIYIENIGGMYICYMYVHYSTLLLRRDMIFLCIYSSVGRVGLGR